MKLPTDYQITSLGDLKRVVVLMTTAASRWNEPLEMTKAQYGRYKELVWRKIQQEDPIRRFDGMEIKISTEAPTEIGDGSV